MNKSRSYTPLEMRISNGAKSPLGDASRRKRFLTAFTLVELLVVIAIIALLMAILMPALSRVKRQAQLTACKVLLHQWALIWQIYCDENDGYFPAERGANWNLGWRRGTWIISLRPEYQTKTDLLRCPVAVTRRLKPSGGLANYGGPFNTYVMGGGGSGIVDPGEEKEECSYGQNCWIYNPSQWAIKAGDIQDRLVEWHWKTPNVAGGNNIPVFADAMWRGGGPFSGEAGAGRFPERGMPPEYDGQWDGYNKEMKHFCINRHQERINILFMDWSVRTVGLKELWTLKWHRQFNTAGGWTKAGGVMLTDWPDWMQKFKDY